MKYHVTAPTPEESVWTCLGLARAGHHEDDYCRTAAYLMWVDSDEDDWISGDLTFAEFLLHWRI